MKLPDLFNPNDYEQIPHYCNQNNEHDPDSTNSGYAYHHPPRSDVMCLEDCDLFRGRGTPKPCRKKLCKHFIYVNPNQTNLTQFFQEATE